MLAGARKSGAADRAARTGTKTMMTAATETMSAGHDENLFAAGPNDDKARQILDGARRIFLRDGFDGASMNDIVRAAGVSKGTLYVYFPSKEALFAALIRHDKQQQAEQTCKWASEGGDVREALTRVGRAFMALLTRPEHIAQVRTVIAVAPRFPEIGRAFYEAGPQFGTAKLAGLLDRHVAAGNLRGTDTTVAAVQFAQLCQGDAYRRLMFGLTDTIPQQEIDETVALAVEVFLRAYGP